jgi:hypothetical protein
MPLIEPLPKFKNFQFNMTNAVTFTGVGQITCLSTMRMADLGIFCARLVNVATLGAAAVFSSVTVAISVATYYDAHTLKGKYQKID